MIKYQLWTPKYSQNGISYQVLRTLSVISSKPTWFWKNCIRYQGLLGYRSINYERFDCNITVPEVAMPSFKVRDNGR